MHETHATTARDRILAAFATNPATVRQESEGPSCVRVGHIHFFERLAAALHAPDLHFPLVEPKRHAPLIGTRAAF